MAAISTRCRWTRTRRRCTGGADEQFEGNSTNSRGALRFSAARGLRSEWPYGRFDTDSSTGGPGQGVSMAWRQQKRDVLDVQVYGVTFLLYRCVLSHTLTLHRLPLRRRYAALEEDTSPCAAAIGAAAAEFTSFLSSAALVSFRSQRFVCHELRALLTTGYPVKGPEARRNSISADEGNFGTSLKIPVQAGGAEGASDAPTGTVLSRPTGSTVS